MTDSIDGWELSVTRHINVPPDRVWDAMANRMSEWFCPRPWRFGVVEEDRRSGGRTVSIMYGPNGEEMRNEGIYLAYEPGKRFAFTDALTADLVPHGPFMIGIFEIAPEGGGTRYTARARHWSEETMKQHQEMGFEPGWAICADQLKALCEEAKVV
jgi:uncharacterized protein YndB with AHSA1/START domain